MEGQAEQQEQGPSVSLGWVEPEALGWMEPEAVGWVEPEGWNTVNENKHLTKSEVLEGL